jgi:RNA polymerase sigma factor for flagellar operon FliA
MSDRTKSGTRAEARTQVRTQARSGDSAPGRASTPAKGAREVVKKYSAATPNAAKGGATVRSAGRSTSRTSEVPAKTTAGVKSAAKSAAKSTAKSSTTKMTTTTTTTATTTKRARNGAVSLPGAASARGGRIAALEIEATILSSGNATGNSKVSIDATAAAGSRSIRKASASDAAVTRAAKAPAKPLPLSERPIDQIWREYRATPTEEVRNFLIARHLDLVAYAAERLHKRLPSEVEINDLKSAGAFGLMDAVESFDPDRGVKFETFCTQRIRGAMFDELRSMDWVPRLVRSRTAKVDKVRKSIEMETGSRPTEEEVAARLNVSGEEFEKLQKDSRPVSMVSLTRKCFETDSSKDVREIDVVEDGRQENPLQAVQKQDLQSLITKGLSRAERLIVILYYYEEMTMKEIGATLDLSESRVSQMHSSILARLKAQMQHRESTEE